MLDRRDTGDLPPVEIVVADETTRDLLGLSRRDAEALDRVGVLDVSEISERYTDPTGAPSNDIVTVAVPTASGDIDVDIAVPHDRLASRAATWGYVITEERAHDLGLEIVDAGLVMRVPDDLADEQRDALGAIRDELWQFNGDSAFIELGDTPRLQTPENFVSIEDSLTFESSPIRFPRALLDAVALAAALLLTLIVVAIGLSLAATGSRDERDVLVSIGAAPRTMRALAASKAIVLCVAAAVLAIPTGFVPVAAVLRAAPEDNRISFPWLVAFGLLAVVPAVAGVAALCTSALAQRLRPVRMSTLAAD